MSWVLVLVCGYIRFRSWSTVNEFRVLIATGKKLLLGLLVLTTWLRKHFPDHSYWHSLLFGNVGSLKIIATPAAAPHHLLQGFVIFGSSLQFLYQAVMFPMMCYVSSYIITWFVMCHHPHCRHLLRSTLHGYLITKSVVNICAQDKQDWLQDWLQLCPYLLCLTVILQFLHVPVYHAPASIYCTFPIGWL